MIVKLENGIPTGQPQGIPSVYADMTNPRLEDMKVRGWVEYAAPEYNSDTHKLGGYVQGAMGAWTHEVVALSEEELQDIATARTASLIAAQEQAIQNHLDDKAKEKGYGDERTAPSVSARSYAGFPNEFQSECILYSQWCADCWIYAYAQLDLILAGQRPMPESPEAFVSELPLFIWP